VPFPAVAAVHTFFVEDVLCATVDQTMAKQKKKQKVNTTNAREINEERNNVEGMTCEQIFFYTDNDAPTPRQHAKSRDFYFFSSWQGEPKAPQPPIASSIER
jgi:hypothetical protein